MLLSSIRLISSRHVPKGSRALSSSNVSLMGTMTKVVCTIGPATDQPAKVSDLVSNGMHVARLNFSHSGTDYSYPSNCMNHVRNTQGQHGFLAAGAIMTESDVDSDFPRNLRAVLVDTKGPEIRTGPLQGSSEIIEIEVGDRVELTVESVAEEPVLQDGHRIQVDYKSIATTLTIGDQVLLDDGLIALHVEEVDTVDRKFVVCTALNAGPIKKNKGVNLPGLVLDLPALTNKDKMDLKWACEVGADFVAASFIRTPGNVRSVIAYLDRCISQLPPQKNGKQRLRPLVISKIESKEGVDNFQEILDESDGIMVARGDLGVEIPYTKVFAAQKMMVNACNLAGKPVIVATQMLDSMIRNPRPTRAEVTDVGTAVFDGADAVMLSGETAAGKYPIESLKAMVSIVHEADSMVDDRSELVWNQELHDSLGPTNQELDGVAASACRSATRMNAKMIVAITRSGRVARAVSRHRPTVPILAFCTDPQVARRLQLHRAIIPIMLQSTLDPASATTRMGILRAEAIRTAKELGYVKAGDRIVLVDQTAGKSQDMHDYSHNMKVATLR